jgi:hypothetical protein
MRIRRAGQAANILNPPHPEEARRAVSKDGAAPRFETRTSCAPHHEADWALNLSLSARDQDEFRGFTILSLDFSLMNWQTDSLGGAHAVDPNHAFNDRGHFMLPAM